MLRLFNAEITGIFFAPVWGLLPVFVRVVRLVRPRVTTGIHYWRARLYQYGVLSPCKPLFPLTDILLDLCLAFPLDGLTILARTRKIFIFVGRV